MLFYGAKPGTERVEFQVRKVTRYIVTGWSSHEYDGGGSAQGSEGYGEYDSASQAYKVASALADAQRRSLGWSESDTRFKGPSDELVTEEAAFYQKLHIQRQQEHAAWMAAHEGGDNAKN